MKHTYIHPLRTLTLLGSMMAVLCSCQEDDLAPQAGSDPQGELQITVTDGGYTGNAATYSNGTWSEQLQTRATENGYKTTFAEGDQVGLYAVKSNALKATNVCLTLTSSVWTPPNGTKLPADADRYFVYYPYQSSVSGAAVPTATTADDFFANVITAWTPATDQSGTNYTKQDLMVGSGTLGSTPENGKYPLTVTLAHKMGLVVIKLPDGVTSITFTGFTPYEGVSGEYRYLVKPSRATSLSGSFVEGVDVRKYTINATISAGAYKTYNILPEQVVYVGMFSGELVGNDTDGWAFSKPLYVQVQDQTEDATTAWEWAPAVGSHSALAGSKTDGRANTWNLNKASGGSLTDFPAANICFKKNNATQQADKDALVWYLPAQEQLMGVWITHSGSNASFGSDKYWSSSEFDNSNSWYVDFSNGNTSSGYGKPTSRNVRCVRE